MTAEEQARPKIPAPEPFGVILLENGQRLSDIEEAEGPFWVGTGNGWYIAKKGLFAWSVLPGPGPMTALDASEVKGHATLTGVRFPKWVVLQAKDFFTRIYNNHKTEAEVCVTYNWDTKQFRVYVPEQWVSGGGVHYRVNPAHLQDGWFIVGTLHSHCNFGAGHSGIDTHDAEHNDGIHITIGDLLKNPVSFAQMLAFGKTRIDLDFDEAVDMSMDGPETAPEWWDRQVHTTGNAPWMPQNNNQWRGNDDYRKHQAIAPNIFQTPVGFRSVYDSYRDAAGGRRYVLPNLWQRQDGTKFSTPSTLPWQSGHWYLWLMEIGVDPRPYLFNKVNFPEHWEKNPQAIEGKFSENELLEIAEQFGDEAPTFKDRHNQANAEPEQPSGPKGKKEDPEKARIRLIANHSERDKAFKELKYKRGKSSNRSTSSQLPALFEPSKDWDRWWQFVQERATQYSKTPEQIVSEMEQLGIALDTESKTVSYGSSAHIPAQLGMGFEDEGEESHMDAYFDLYTDELIRLRQKCEAAGLMLSYSLVADMKTIPQMLRGH